MRIDQILAALARLSPSARQTKELRRAAERLLARLLEEGGLRAVERAIVALNAKGRRFQPLWSWRRARGWREVLAQRRRAIDIRVAANRSYTSASLRYFAVPRLSAAQRKLQALQQRFYERYLAIGKTAYRTPPGKITPTERRLLLIGEFEADVHNGGFAQYLDNKGTRRARAALVALYAVGARKTAHMLATAMAPGASDAELAALDDAFYQAPEDLAVLAARHAGLGD